MSPRGPVLRLPLLTSLAVALAGCNRSVVVHLQPMMGGVDPQTRTATLDPGDPQPIGGTRVNATFDCPVGTTADEIRICIGNSRSCAQETEQRPVAGVIVLYKCGIADPPAGGGLGPLPPGP